MLRFVLILILIVFVARAFWRLVDGMLEGLTGSRRRTPVPQRGVQMVRDPRPYRRVDDETCAQSG